MVPFTKTENVEIVENDTFEISSIESGLLRRYPNQVMWSQRMEEMVHRIKIWIRDISGIKKNGS